MSGQRVTPGQFEKVMMDILKKYGDDSFEICQTEAKTAARGAVSDLKSSAPAGGSYARGWSHKGKKSGRTGFSDTVYNRTDYQLTHLLEKPHATGRYRGGHYPSGNGPDYTGTIARVEQEYTQKFIEGVERKL